MHLRRDRSLYILQATWNPVSHQHVLFLPILSWSLYTYLEKVEWLLQYAKITCVGLYGRRGRHLEWEMDEIQTWHAHCAEGLLHGSPHFNNPNFDLQRSQLWCLPSRAPFQWGQGETRLRQKMQRKICWWHTFSNFQASSGNHSSYENSIKGDLDVLYFHYWLEHLQNPTLRQFVSERSSLEFLFETTTSAMTATNSTIERRRQLMKNLSICTEE